MGGKLCRFAPGFCAMIDTLERCPMGRRSLLRVLTPEIDGGEGQLTERRGRSGKRRESMAKKADSREKEPGSELEELKRALNERQIRFVHELLRNGGNGTLAAVAAGYSERSAAVQASRMLSDDKIAAYRRACARQIYQNLGISEEQIGLDLREIYNRCMQAQPHMSWDSEAHDWVPDGTWVFDSRGAIKALDMLLRLSGRLEPPPVAVTLSLGEKQAKLRELLQAVSDDR